MGPFNRSVAGFFLFFAYIVGLFELEDGLTGLVPSLLRDASLFCLFLIGILGLLWFSHSRCPICKNHIGMPGGQIVPFPTCSKCKRSNLDAVTFLKAEQSGKALNKWERFDRLNYYRHQLKPKDTPYLGPHDPRVVRIFSK